MPPDVPLSFRHATTDDVPFIIECLLASEASGTDIISYQRIFGLSEVELRDFFLQLAQEEMPGNAFSYVNYWIAEAPNGKKQVPVAGLAAWVEAEDEMLSNTQKAQALAYFLGIERWRAANDKMQKAASIDIERTVGSLQLDSIAVLPSYRGQGVLGHLITYVLQWHKTHKPNVTQAEIILMDDNVPARRAYEKAGFALLCATHSDDPVVPTLLPGKGRLLMQRTL